MDKIHKNSITKEWQANLNGFVKYKEMWLVKPCDCVVMGIYLDTPSMSDYYYPYFHFHSLLRDFPVLSFEVKRPIMKRFSHLTLNETYKVKNIIESFQNENPVLNTESNIYNYLHNYYIDDIKNFLSDGGTHPYIVFSSLLKIMDYYKRPEKEIMLYISWFYDYINQNRETNLWKREFEIDKIKLNTDKFLMELGTFDYTNKIYENKIKLKIK
jgi:hypothetical protein